MMNMGLFNVLMGFLFGFVIATIIIGVYFLTVNHKYINKMNEVCKSLINRNCVYEDDIEDLHKDNFIIDGKRFELEKDVDSLESQVIWLITVVNAKNGVIKALKNVNKKLENDKEKLYESNVELNKLLLEKDEEILNFVREGE
jgi:hypothetical protein